jgi:hypothetical protein
MKNNGLVFNVFIAIMQSITNTYRPPHVSPREGVGRVVSNNTINNIYIYIYYKNKGFGLGELVQSGPLQLICIKYIKKLSMNTCNLRQMAYMLVIEREERK